MRHFVLVVVALGLVAISGFRGSSDSALSAGGVTRDGRIAFERGGALYAVAPDGTGVRKVAMTPARRGLVCDGPAWSPGGAAIAFVGHYSSGTLNRDELLVRVSTGQTRGLGDTGRGEGGVSWSPDGRQIVVGSGGDEPLLRVFNAATGAARAIRLPGDRHSFADGFDPAWSPDSSVIAYRFGKGALCRHGNCTLALQGLALVRPDGSGYRQLTRLGGDPAWSPDGQRIAFTRLDRVGDIFTEMEGDSEHGISVINRDGAHLQQVTTRPGDRDPAWSPSGLYIVFTRGSAARSALWIMRSDGTNQHLLVPNGSRAAWEPS